MRFWILIFSVVYCEEKNENFEPKEVFNSTKSMDPKIFNSTVYMSTLAEKAMKSIRYYIEVGWNFSPITWSSFDILGYGGYANPVYFAEIRGIGG